MKTKMRDRRSNRWRSLGRFAAAGGLLAVAGALWAAFPITNPTGASLRAAVTHAYTATDQRRPYAIHLELAATHDASVDTSNTAGVKAYLGLILPDKFGPTRAGKAWLEIE